MTNIFQAVLARSRGKRNRVLEAAEALWEEGYSIEEICTSLQDLEITLIREEEAQIVEDALQTFSHRRLAERMMAA